MPYDKSYVRLQALIEGISLLKNVFERLDKDKASIRELSAEWITTIYPAINDQMQIIMSTSADNITSKYLADRLIDLNDHLLSDNPHERYARRLARYALHAMVRCAQSHSNIWNEVQIQSIITALGSSYAVKQKRFTDYEDEEEEKKKKKKIKVLEYNPDRF